MEFGLATYDEAGREIIVDYAPYNLLGVYPMQLGTHQITIPDLQGVLEYTYDFGDFGRGTTEDLYLEDVSVSGSTLTYTTSNTSSNARAQGGVFMLYARRTS